MKIFILCALSALSLISARLQARVTEINPGANDAKGLLSQAVRVVPKTPLIFVSGQLPFDVKTKNIMEGDIKAMTNRVIDQIEQILKAGGSDLKHVIRVEIFVKDLKDFAAINEVYVQRFQSDTMPTRQTIQVAALPFNSPIEMSCIAYPAVEKKKWRKEKKWHKKDWKHKKHEKNHKKTDTKEKANAPV